MVTQCWHFSSFPITGHMFPSVCCSCREAVNWSTTMPRGAGRLTVATSPAMGSRGTAKPSTFTRSARFGTGLTARQFGEPAPWLRKRLKDCTKHTVLWSALHVDHPPCETVKRLLMLKALISCHTCRRSTRSMHFQQYQLATLCRPLCSLKQTMTVSHRYGYVLWLLQLALTPVGILKTHSLFETY